ncbi:PLP-dependent aminotransferase family protein [Flexivirga sp. ID2601S]|uniref:PLP-dependent aminotransferase family protein n=1 Tax=Flexivirga aerilata TaxID=1656889 RepID=A0A849AQ55_9MICO|nr:PLP-dependent aminotransferase family protein [Flexivirga aerilata]NNG38912.1 PLP-dependent aminotransferase family protein [Flexivirga aerilata]
MTGADFLQLDPSRAPARGVTEWLTGQLRGAIADGRLSPGARLPATRELAADLRIARGAVVEAYQRLREEGLVDGRTRAGTTVRSAPARPQRAGRRSAAVTTPTSPHPGAAPSGIRLDLYPGLPDLTDFPRAAWLRHERAVLTETPAAELGYGDPRGHPVLRAELAAWLSRTRGLRVGADGIIVVTGVAQSLALLGQQLVRDGKNIVAVEDPGSAGAVQQLEHWGVHARPVPVDADGLVVERLASTRARSVFVTPAHQFPTGVVLSAARRRDLVEWAGRGRLIIEDDYDADQRYDRAPVAAIQPAAPDLVAHTGSTSKSLAPGLRLGWLVPPPRLYDDLVVARRASDLGGPALAQLVLARFIASGDYDRHLRRQRARQRHRRDVLLEALAAALPDAAIGGVAAGLHVQVTFPHLAGRLDDRDLAADLARRGVRVQPLRMHRHTPGEPGLVLGYGAESPDGLAEAVGIIARVVAGAGGSRGRSLCTPVSIGGHLPQEPAPDR